MAVATELSDHEVLERIDVLHGAISAHQRDLLRYVAECDDRRRWRKDGARDMAEWLAGRLGISKWAAGRWVHAAHSLEHLALTSEALLSGSLRLDKVLELTRFATSSSEHSLITWAQRVSTAAIRRKADLFERVAIEDVRHLESARYLRWWSFDDGKRIGLGGEFPAAHGHAITAAISRLAQTLPEHPDKDPDPFSAEDSLARRRADALYLMAQSSVAEDSDSPRATVVVRTTLESTEEGREISGGPVIHPQVYRRLSCDARLQFVVTDRKGNALGIGRTSRNIPSWLMHELSYRDKGCTFPGCHMKAFTQAHHIKHWEDGGPTDLHNLVLTCYYHHRLVHEHGWDVRLIDSVAQWMGPGGERFHPGPDPPQLAMAS